MPPPLRRMPSRLRKHLDLDVEEERPYDQLKREGRGRIVGWTPIYGVYFICCIGAYKEIVAEQLETARRSGLLAKTTKLICFICRYDPEIDAVLAPFADKLKVISTTENLYEKFALTQFQDYIPSPHYYVYYFHSKGVSHESGSVYHERRRNLDYFILEKHEACLFWLDNGHDAVGAALSLYPTLHFSGNFWWAASRHIARLPREIGDAYLAPEMHVCSVPDGRYISVSQDTNKKTEREPLTTEQVLRQSTRTPIRNIFCRRFVMNVQCFICHDAVRVPVRLTCFPCDTKPGQPTCNSITRVCLLCAREYLQLNKKRRDRVATRKCLTCPATVHCSNLSSFNSYEKDFFIMSVDTRDDYPCFHVECPFKGTQNALNHHIQSECAHRSIFCQLCRDVYIAKDENDHIASCPERFCCPRCHEHVPNHEQKAHYMERHNMQKCRYCHELVESPGFSAHYEECPERPRDCPHCYKPVARCQLHDHMIAHIENFQKVISQNNKSNADLFNAINLLLVECKKHGHRS